MGIWQKWLFSWERWWNPGLRADESPCSVFPRLLDDRYVSSHFRFGRVSSAVSQLRQFGRVCGLLLRRRRRNDDVARFVRSLLTSDKSFATPAARVSLCERA